MNKCSGLLLVSLLLVGFFEISSLSPVYAVTLVQEAWKEVNAVTFFNCTYTSDVTLANLLILGFSTTTTGSTVTSISDTVGSTWVLRQTVTTTGASTNTKGTLYSALAAASGSNVINVTLSGSSNQLEISCAEFNSVTNGLASSLTGTGTYTDTGQPVVTKITSYTPTAGNLVYVWTSAQPCGGYTAKSYDSAYTSGAAGGASGAGQGTGVNCKGIPGARQFTASEGNMWTEWVSGSTTANINFTSGTARLQNTGGWLTIVTEWLPTSQPAIQVIQPNFGGVGVLIGTILGSVLIVALVRRRRR